MHVPRYLPWILIVAAPLSLLILFPHATFNLDWNNNVWMVSYARAAFTDHLRFPAVYNVSDRVGIPQPIFYGPLLYPCLALLSVPFGADVGIRLACIGVWSLQFWLIYRLCRRIGASALYSIGAAALVSWAIYPLTNLYNRGALAEFCATTFLTCAMAAGGSALLDPQRRKRIAFGLLTAICAAMAICSHGPTALVGGPLMLVLGLAAMCGAWRTLLKAACLALLVAAIISPWAYVLKSFASQLTIEVPGNPYYPVAGSWQRYPSTDAAWARLKPLPLDDGWTTKPGAKETKYVDAQWNLPLVFLAFWSAAKALKSRRYVLLILLSAAACVGLLILSISPWLQNLLPQHVGGSIQFPYRLVTHANLAALVLLLAAWAARPPEGRLMFLSFLLVISAAGMAIKLAHAAETMSAQGVSVAEASDDYLQNLPSTFNGQLDYTLQVPLHELPRSLQQSPLLLKAPIGRGPSQDVEEIQGGLPESMWIVPTVMNFPWNHLVIDGKTLAFDEVHNLYFHEAVFLSAGTHSIGYRFEPDPIWVGLTVFSWIVFAGTIAACAVYFVRR